MSPGGLSPSRSLAPGTRLGAFEVLAPLGHGGMGAVYRVRNRITGDERALKLILPELAASPEFVDRFVREIRLAMAVEHPNLVRVFEPGMDGDNIFLPMELLEGESLAAHLKRERVLHVSVAVSLLQAIGSALSALHARGILHRDVKPSNIFIAFDGARYTPKLLDLGAGKEVGGSDEATATGAAIGSPHYMAPEQASGRKDLDPRVDQYAFGVLAYQVLTGARPYENDDTGHVLAKVLCGAAYKRPREIRPDIPVGMEAAILRAMSRDKADRFPGIDDFVRALTDPSYVEEGPVPVSLEGTRLAPVAARVPEASTAYVPPPNERTGNTGNTGNTGPTGSSGTIGPSVVAPPPATSSRGLVWAVLAAAVVLSGIGIAVMSTRTEPSHASGSPVTPQTPAATPAPVAAQPPPSPPVASAEPPATPPPTATPQAATDPSPPPTPTAPQPPVSVTPVTPAAPAVHTVHPPRPKAAPTPAADAPCHATPGAPCL